MGKFSLDFTLKDNSVTKLISPEYPSLAADAWLKHNVGCLINWDLIKQYKMEYLP